MMRRRPFRRSRSPFTLRALVFEIVTIVIGVLIALGVNETRERLRDARQARALQQALYVESLSNCRRFTDALAYHEPLLTELDSVIAADPEAASPQAMPSATRGLGPVLPSTSVYETARATGDISLLGLELAFGLGTVHEVTSLYRQSVSRVLDAIAQRDAKLSDVRQPYLLMREMQGAARSATCSAYAALARETGAAPDSTLVAGAGSF